MEKRIENSLPKPTKVGCPLMDTKSGKTIDGYMEVWYFDPALMLKEVADYDDFDRVMGADLVWTFWDNVRPDDPRLLTLMAENHCISMETMSSL